MRNPRTSVCARWRCLLRLPLLLLAAPALAAEPALPPAKLVLSSPVEFQVFQRRTRDRGELLVRGAAPKGARVEARWGAQGVWALLLPAAPAGEFSARLDVAAGGWRTVFVRVLRDGAVVAESQVERVGVGEVFIVAGQSNSANHGEERQQPKSDRVAASDGLSWRPAHDPQPGASGQGGSFLPPLGDLLVAKLDVPVGLVACGVGATSVREWLPSGATFPNPPTLEGRVKKRSDGLWESKGEAYNRLLERMQALGPGGFRAVLWHQGESDANQKDATRTLPGALYREYLTQLITESRRASGWQAPWFVAQVSYHVPGDEASPDIRAAQAALWKDGVALAGPDSDALKGALRERGGQGVHFSGPGLREHAARWAEKVLPWLEQQP